MSDPVTRLNAALWGRYTIERELGEGRPVGMFGVLAGFWMATLCASSVMAQSVPRVIPAIGCRFPAL